jgi:uncharacterized membrane protein YdjX (TVP38/TMEM64 family)
MTSNPPADPEGEGEKESNNKLQTWLVIIIAVVLSVAFLYYIALNEASVKTFIRDAGIFGPIVSILLIAALGLSPIPSEIIIGIVGGVYGGLGGTIIGFLGNMGASVIEYYVGGHIGKLADFEERKQHMPFGLGKIPANSALFLIAARIIPGYGPKMVGIVAGLYKVPLWRYMWTGAVAILLGAAFIAFGGATLMNTLWGH